MADPYAPFGFARPRFATLSGRENPSIPLADMPMMPPPPTFTPHLMPQSPGEASAVAGQNRNIGSLAEIFGMAPLYRSGQHLSQGRPLEAAGNAAVAMMPYRPALAMGGLGAAYGAALGADLLPGMGAPQAQAQQPAGDPDSAMLMNLLTQQSTLRAQAEAARQRMEAERASGEGRRFNAARQEYEAASARATAMDNQVKLLNDRLSPEAKQARTEYTGAVNMAEQRLTEARARVPVPFKNTNVGRLYETTGGWTPAVVAAGTSGLARAVGHSPRRATTEGVLAGAATPNAPFAWDLFSQPAYNPERAMYADYARDLPPTHPRRAEWTAYAASLPEENPARRLAADEFYSPFKFAERTGLGAYEGLVGGLFGTGIAEGGRRIAGAGRSGQAGTPGRAPNTQAPPAGSSAASATEGAAVPPGLPPLAQREGQAGPLPGGHWVAPGARPAPGEIETWVSPAGQRSVTRPDSGGAYRDERGRFTAPPVGRRGWRRISEAAGGSSVG